MRYLRGRAPRERRRAHRDEQRSEKLRERHELRNGRNLVDLFVHVRREAHVKLQRHETDDARDDDLLLCVLREDEEQAREREPANALDALPVVELRLV